MSAPDIPTEKPCSKCGVTKPLEEFAIGPRYKYGREAQCKACKRAWRHGHRPRKRPALIRTGTEQECSKCKEVKPYADFARNNAKRSGYNSYCRTCMSSYAAERKAPAPERECAYPECNRLVPATKKRNAVYCSVTCCERAKYSDHMDTPVACPHCGIEFLRNSAFQRFCSTECKETHGNYRARRMAYNAKHRAENPEQYRARYARRRVRLKVDMTREDVALSVEYRKAIANDPCHYCGERTEKMHDDHYHALANGGTDQWHNLVRACSTCNLRKNDKHGDDFKALLASEKEMVNA